MPKSIHGIIPIVAATFSANGALDEDSFQHLVRHLLASGVQALTLFGLATEFYKLTEAERARMQTLLLEATAASPDVAGIISITDHSWEVAATRAQTAEAQGADALMLLPPFFLGPSEEAILEHLRRVVGAVRIPVIIQYAPAQTGVRIAPATFLRLHEEFANAAFVKVETQPPGRYITQLREGSGGRLGALVGYAGMQMPDALARGAAGVQPGCSFSELYVELWRRWRANPPGFYELHGRMLPYLSYWMQGVELIVRAEKIMLHRRGIIASDYCRSPAYTLDRGELIMVERFLEEFALL